MIAFLVVISYFCAIPSVSNNIAISTIRYASRAKNSHAVTSRTTNTVINNSQTSQIFSIYVHMLESMRNCYPHIAQDMRTFCHEYHALFPECQLISRYYQFLVRVEALSARNFSRPKNRFADSCYQFLSGIISSKFAIAEPAC